MEPITVKAAYLRAAMLFQGKKDPRPYLNCVNLTVSGLVQSSNGHYGFRARDNIQGINSNLLVRISGTIPAKAYTAELNFVSGTEGYISFKDMELEPVCNANTGMKEIRYFELFEGKFPDIDRVMPKGDPVPTAEIGVNPNYLGMLGDCFKALGGRKICAGANFTCTEKTK